MNEHALTEALWQRVHRVLDAREDPREDPELALLLGEDSGEARALRRLIARLDLLGLGAPVPVAPDPADPRRMRPHLVPALLAAAALLAGFTLWWRAPAPDAPARAPRRVDTSAITLELSVVHSSLSAATGERVVVAPRPVLAWTLEGDEPCPR